MISKRGDRGGCYLMLLTWAVEQSDYPCICGFFNFLLRLHKAELRLWEKESGLLEYQQFFYEPHINEWIELHASS